MGVCTCHTQALCKNYYTFLSPSIFLQKNKTPAAMIASIIQAHNFRSRISSSLNFLPRRRTRSNQRALFPPQHRAPGRPHPLDNGVASSPPPAGRSPGAVSRAGGRCRGDGEAPHGPTAVETPATRLPSSTSPPWLPTAPLVTRGVGRPGRSSFSARLPSRGP